MRGREIAVWLTLVVSGVVLRLGFEDIPNFAPVAAIALFAGYVLRNRILAVTAPLAVMLASDAHFGGYHSGVMLAVYGALALPALAGAPLRKWMPMSYTQGIARSMLGLVVTAIGFSLIFFLVTNFAVWIYFDMYGRTWPGLLECYVQALPFYRYTLLGDTSFALLLFGALAAYRVYSVVTTTQLSPQDS